MMGRTMQVLSAEVHYVNCKAWALPPLQGIGTARHSETLEEMVVYRALYGDGGLWVRPAAMWAEQVERDGYHGPRFLPVEGA